MKHCPKCIADTRDDSQRFCLDDGAILVTETQPAVVRGTADVRIPQPTAPRSKPGSDRPSVEKEPPARRQWWPCSWAGGSRLCHSSNKGWWLSARSGDELLYQTRHDNTGADASFVIAGRGT